MKKRDLLNFIKKYKYQFIGAFNNSFVPVMIYTLYKFAFIINRLKFDLYPELPWEERAPLIEKVRSVQIIKTIIVSMVIIVIVYFPLLLLRFKVDLNDSFFNRLKAFKDEKVNR